MSELKPCPFCGGKAMIDYGFSSSLNASGVFAYVFCEQCRVSGSRHTSEEQAKKAWNTRHERTCMLASTQLTHHGPYGNTYHTHKIVCSECRHDMPDHGESIKYCPWCGAKVVDR